MEWYLLGCLVFRLIGQSLPVKPWTYNTLVTSMLKPKKKSNIFSDCIGSYKFGSWVWLGGTWDWPSGSCVWPTGSWPLRWPDVLSHAKGLGRKTNQSDVLISNGHIWSHPDQWVRWCLSQADERLALLLCRSTRSIHITYYSTTLLKCKYILIVNFIEDVGLIRLCHYSLQRWTETPSGTREMQF